MNRREGIRFSFVMSYFGKSPVRDSLFFPRYFGSLEISTSFTVCWYVVFGLWGSALTPPPPVSLLYLA